jgi:hypothetical protein
MKTLFDAQARDEIVQRLARLEPSSRRQWGKMDVAQMAAHCAAAMEIACGDRTKRQALIGRVLAPFVKSTALGEKPFGRNAPTDPEFRISDARNFANERTRLVGLVERFCARGPSGADGLVHSFFGRLTADEWGRLMYKHLDHHLRQFNA